MNLSPGAGVLRNMLTATLLARDSIELGELQMLAKSLAPLVPQEVTAGDIDTVIDLLMESQTVTLADGVSVIDRSTFTPWVEQRKGDTLHRRSDAYTQLLVDKGWSSKVIDKLGEQTDRIMDLVGDPTAPGAWSRRGLAIGEVQSGKTATYIGLLAKAIDYGYRVIIVIGGHTEDLRRQTQSRLDSDLVGQDSSYTNDNIVSTDVGHIGVGLLDKTLPSKISLETTTEQDFNRARSRGGKGAFGEGGHPALFVVKKNATVLKNLARYLAQVIPKAAGQAPLLLIDDESDWASINTKSEEDITAVNSAIRDLLSASNRNSYLGITATPFANIFINDEAEEDLFPRDYIQVLESPSNYQGVSQYFVDSTSGALIEDVEDTLTTIPYSHKSGHRVRQLPDSIRRGVAAFYLGTALRRLRDGEERPASMLINVSRFKGVQRQVHNLVGEFIDELSQTIRGEFGMPEGGPQSERAQLLVAVFQEIYPDVDSPWSDVRRQLVSVAEEMRTQLVNGDTKKERDRFLRVTPPRVRKADALVPTIYVGGDVLARGLTLEGLQVSYYSRRAGAADTLLQMGRWFGYRPGYEDLVRLWIDSETSELFRWTADLSKELRESLAAMNAKELTPKYFGLKMKRHPEGFQIASARKLKGAVDHEGEKIGINGRVWESHALPSDDRSRAGNLKALADLYERLPAEAETTSSGQRVWRDVESSLVHDLLTAFRGHRYDQPFGGDGLGESLLVRNFSDIKNNDLWDVAFVSGNGATSEVQGLPALKTSIRNNLVEERAESRIEFANRRVASGADLRTTVREEVRARLVADNNGAPLNDRELARKALTNPTLLLYTITASGGQSHDPDPADGPGRSAVVANPAHPIAAVVVVTPQLTIEEEQQEIEEGRGARWKINSVYAREILGMSTTPEEDTDDDEELA